MCTQAFALQLTLGMCRASFTTLSPFQGPGPLKNNQPTNQTKTDEQLWTASGNLTEVASPTP